MNRIKQLRLELGLSQAELAKKLNRTQQVVSLYEKGINEPDMDGYEILSNLFGCSIEYIAGKSLKKQYNPSIINVYSSVHAGILSEMIENIVDTEEISQKLASSDKEYFGLKIKGDSMQPKYLENDTIIVEKTSSVESGTDAVVAVNGNEAFLKRIYINSSGITLQALNPKYEPLFYTNEEIKSVPVTIMGKVVELRRKI